MNIAYLFPGQGSQYVGMAKELYESSSKAKEILDKVSELFSQHHGNRLSKRLLELMFEGPEEELKRTIYTQPAILAHSLALMAELKVTENFIKPNLTAGHSLGEFSALITAGVLSLEDGINLVLKRAELMESAPAGAMTAIIGIAEDDLNAVLENIEGASVANYNSPEQIVITGSKEAVKNAEEALSAHAENSGKKAKIIPLVVGGAFHSPLMKDACDKFSQEIDSVEFKNAEIPVIQNFSAKITSDSGLIKENLKKQMTGSVQWTKTVEQLISGENRVDKIYEIGPGKVLAGLVKKADRSFPVESISKLSLLTI